MRHISTSQKNPSAATFNNSPAKLKKKWDTFYDTFGGLQGKWLVQNYADAISWNEPFVPEKKFNGLWCSKIFVFWRFDLRDLSKHLGGVRFVHKRLVIFGAAPIPLSVCE
jgi:hypothetical protein